MGQYGRGATAMNVRGAEIGLARPTRARISVGELMTTSRTSGASADLASEASGDVQVGSIDDRHVIAGFRSDTAASDNDPDI